MLLTDIEHSKQFSKNTNETYSTKTQQYKENYSETYITKWQFLIDYLKNESDNIFIKIIKVLLISFNFLLFITVKTIIFIIIWIIYILDDLLDYLIGIIILIAFLFLFILTKNNNPGHIPFIPINVEKFFLYIFIATGIELLKTLIITKSLNLYALIQNIEDKIFIKVLMK